ncbi:MAG: hypothetical protein FWC60_11590 [Firmicutes bacterium]|nr:hypothetical protein [Bacillota bacterium]
MQHTTNTKVIFADSAEEASQKYLALGIKTEDPKAVLECYKAIEDEEFDLTADFNFIGEISVSPEVMEVIRQDPDRAYVLYFLEN